MYVIAMSSAIITRVRRRSGIVMNACVVKMVCVGWITVGSIPTGVMQTSARPAGQQDTVEIAVYDGEICSAAGAHLSSGNCSRYHRYKR